MAPRPDATRDDSVVEPAREQWVPRDALLDAWTACTWTDGVQVEQLPALQGVRVQTRNTTYDITVIDGSAGEVLITGGRFFPIPTRARLNGCTLGGSCLKWRGLYTGLRMEIQVGRESIVTTRIRSVALQASPTDVH
jgi:hypothetical protein